MGAKLGPFSRGLLWVSGGFFLLMELMLLVEDLFAAFLWLFLGSFIWLVLLRVCVFMCETGDQYEYTASSEVEEDLSGRDDSGVPRRDSTSRILPSARRNRQTTTPLRMSAADEPSRQRRLEGDVADFLRSTPF